MTEETEPTEPGPLSEENQASLLYWTALATMLGFNELAKLGKTLGEKVYFRLLRDDMSLRFVELGGNGDVFAQEEAVVEIKVPFCNGPTVRFRAQDIELMRDAVYEHDKARRSSPETGAAK